MHSHSALLVEEHGFLILKIPTKSIRVTPTLDLQKQEANSCSAIQTMLVLLITFLNELRGFPGGSAVKNRPAMQETQVQSLGWEDPLQYSCLGNLMDRGTWWATVYGSDKS